MKEARDTFVGRREDAHLEFQRDDLGDEALLRVVVAFLNSGGGQLVIGVEERHGVAVAETGVREPHALLKRIERILPTSIEPSPLGLVAWRAQRRGTKGPVLVIVEVQPGAGGQVFALRKGSALIFFIRQGAEIRAMTLREVVERIKHPTASVRPEDQDPFSRGLACAREGAKGGAALFVGLRPLVPPAADPSAWTRAATAVGAALKDEVPFDLPIGLREWSLGLYPHFEPEWDDGELRFGRDQPLYRFVRARRDGMVWGAMRLEPGWPGAYPQLDRGVYRSTQDVPEALLGLLILDRAIIAYAASVVRLASLLWREQGIGGGSEGRAALLSEHRIGVKSWTGELVEPPVDPGPIELEAELVLKTPDRAMERIIEQLFVLAGARDAWRRIPFKGDRLSFSASGPGGE